MESPQVSDDVKQYIAGLVVEEHKLSAGNFSETSSTALIGAHTPQTKAQRVGNGYRITGRKMFASMLEAADFCAVFTHPEGSTHPSAGL